MGDLGAAELLIILAILLVVFGPARLVGLGAGLGSAIKSFRRGVREDEPEAEPEGDQPAPPAA